MVCSCLLAEAFRIIGILWSRISRSSRMGFSSKDGHQQLCQWLLTVRLRECYEV